jgi:hypothetical protein
MTRSTPTQSSAARVSAFAAACALSIAAPTAGATAVSDPLGDILSTYAGPSNPAVDTLAADVRYDPLAGTLTFFARVAGAISGAPVGARYVWGVDRGQGTERFVAGTPSVGAGVVFDSVLLVDLAGAGTINLFGLGGGATNFPAGTFTLVGNEILATVAASAFPGLSGRTTEQFTYNFWPRVGVGSNDQISDFAPDASNAPVSVVPEPASLALVLGSLAVLGTFVRSRQRAKE